jgi:glycosyltransferase involved in cell wall biosynthesis
VIATSRSAAPIEAGSLSIHPASGKTPLGRAVRLIRVGDSLCRRIRPDLISAQTADVYGLVGLFLSRRHGIPLQVQVHTDVLSPYYRKASWREGLRYRIALFTLPRASCVRVVSRRIARQLTERLSIPPSKIRVLPIRSDVPARMPNRGDPSGSRGSAGGFRIVSAGRFVDREKNFSMLMGAMTTIRREVPGATLVLVGGGPDRRRYERLVREAGLQPRVRLEPWREDLDSYLASFDLFVLPSNFEGWGRACVEAAAAGVPVVMTDVGLAGELLIDGESARVVPVGDRQALTQAILDLASDPAQRDRLARNAFEAVSHAGGGSMEAYAAAYRAAMVDCAARSASR